MEDIRRVPEWVALSGRENRYPNQFGGIGDDGDGSKDSFRHVNGNGEAVVVPGVNCTPEEASQLEARGAVFPMEVAQPLRATFVNGNGEVILPPQPASTIFLDVQKMPDLPQNS